jgi:branched-chain amino acid transport system substrate-binding protein
VHPRGRSIFHLVLPALLSACSLTTFDRSPCQSHSECRDNFGLGSTCGDDGSCSAREEHPRCERSFPEGLLDDPEAARMSIVLGSLFDANNETHRAREKSIRMALRQINDEGGLEDRPFGVVMCSIQAGLENTSANDGTTPGALSAAGYLARVLEVPAIIGPTTSTDVLAVFEAIRDTDTFLISPSATSSALTAVDRSAPNDDTPGLLWRPAPPDSLQGLAIATDMSARDVSSVAVIAEAGAYGEGLFETFNETYDGFVRLDTFRDANQRAQAIVSAGASGADEVLFIASAQSDVELFLRNLGPMLRNVAIGQIVPGSHAAYLAQFLVPPEVQILAYIRNIVGDVHFRGAATPQSGQDPDYGDAG